MNRHQKTLVVMSVVAAILVAYLIVGWPWGRFWESEDTQDLYAELETTAKKDSFANCTYRVSTGLWVRSKKGLPSILEASKTEYRVKGDRIEQVRQEQRLKLWDKYMDLENMIQGGYNPCERGSK